MNSIPKLAPKILALAGVLVLVALFPLASNGSLTLWVLAKLIYVIGLILFLRRV